MMDPFAQKTPPRLRIIATSLKPQGKWRVAVDLSLLRAGGENGGVKPFIYQYLHELTRREAENLTLIFLTWSQSHHEVRALARLHDELVCVRHLEPNLPVGVGNWRDGEIYLPNPPPDLLLHLEADLLYSPLGSPEFACPGIPTLATIVDLLHRDYSATLDAHTINVRESMFRSLKRCTDCYHCISHYSASRLSACYDIPLDRTFCTHLVIHERLELGDRDIERSAGAKPYFFYPANFWRHKNHETLFVAYRLYAEEQGKNAWSLVLTGHADERMDRLKTYAENLGIADRVHFAGHLADDEFTKLWHNAGALVFPSLYEGFGIPLVEAMHFGIPILCSREASLPEVADDAALYADTRAPHDLARALTQIAGQVELQDSLRARGRARLTQFSLSKDIDIFRRKMRDTTDRPARRWHRGVYPDGWMEQWALFSLPVCQSVLRIEIEFLPSPASRRVRFYRALNPLGGIDVPAGERHVHSLRTQADGAPLRIEVVNAANLAPNDHRMHGVLLGVVTAIDEEGNTYNLREDEI